MRHRLFYDKASNVGVENALPVAVLPCATAKAAKLQVKLWNDVTFREDIMLAEFDRQEKAADEGWEPGRIDMIRGFLSALGFPTPDKAEGKAP